jgi:nitroreductase
LAPSPPFQGAFNSGDHLARHFAGVPLLLIGFAKTAHGGSVFPALQNAMLAARAEGVGTTLTMFLNSRQEAMLALLGVPLEDAWKMQACVALGYPTGRWGVAPRRPAHEVTFRNRWGDPPGFEVPEPLRQPEDDSDRDRAGEVIIW